MSSMISAVAPIRTLGRRAFSSSRASMTKVVVLGAAGPFLSPSRPLEHGADTFPACPGGIGQPLSLLLKQNPLVTKLSLFDIRGSIGVAADISHVNTPAQVCSPSTFPRVFRKEGESGGASSPRRLGAAV